MPRPYQLVYLAELFTAHYTELRGRTLAAAAAGGVNSNGAAGNGRDYRVTFVDPYTSYGAGFVQAHCELVDFNGGTPVE
ncbi:hypothetical protein CBX33_19855 [Salmonella enterica]|nr:hypothetical protein [Salmonella enterica]ECI4595728.1 hypothetical protein [Salmonella enterica subsp. salamae]HAO4184085.1 hypothetical protein [Salmonella enterica]